MVLPMQDFIALLNPLAINPLTRKGKQVILENPEYGYRHEISSFPGMLEPPNTDDRSDGYADTAEKKE